MARTRHAPCHCPASVREPKPCFRPLRAEATEVTGARLGRANHLTSHRTKLVTLAKGDAGERDAAEPGSTVLAPPLPRQAIVAESLPSKPQFPFLVSRCQAHHQFITRPSLPCLGVLSGPFLWTLVALGSQSSPPHPPVSQLPWFHLSNLSGAFWDTFLRWHIPCSTSGAPHCSRMKPRSLCSGP